jgi:hypothetical protein
VEHGATLSSAGLFSKKHEYEGTLILKTFLQIKKPFLLLYTGTLVAKAGLFRAKPKVLKSLASQVNGLAHYEVEITRICRSSLTTNSSNVAAVTYFIDFPPPHFGGGSKVRLVRGADNLTAIYEPIA